MELKFTSEDQNYGELMITKQIHLVLPATLMGFGMCMAYLRFNCKMDDHNISRFVNQVNDRREVGCLHPKYNLTLFPSRYDEWKKNVLGFSREEYYQYFEDIIKIETNYIKSNRIVIDLFASSMDVKEKEEFCTTFTSFLAIRDITNVKIIEIRKNIR